MAAERRELDGVLAHAWRAVRLDWPVQFASAIRLQDWEILLLANGPGPKLAGRAAEIAKEHYQELQGLVSIGFCGALDPALRPGDILVPSSIATEAGAFATAMPSRSPSAQGGKLLSLDRVITSSSEKAELRRTGCAAVEMEAGGLAERAVSWKLPLYCVKVVSDTAAEDLPLDFNRLRDSEGRFSRPRIVAAALRRPAWIFPRLIRLDKRCKSASKALGDFIADTRF